jgi:hypothetical protein
MIRERLSLFDTTLRVGRQFRGVDFSVSLVITRLDRVIQSCLRPAHRTEGSARTEGGRKAPALGAGRALPGPLARAAADGKWRP